MPIELTEREKTVLYCTLRMAELSYSSDMFAMDMKKPEEWTEEDKYKYDELRIHKQEYSRLIEKLAKAEII